MPVVSFDALPADARVWVFAADAPLGDDAERVLLTNVDAFLSQWNAHGHALRCARAWRDARFLAIGVDQSTAGASGCSIDGLFRVFKELQPKLGASLMPGPRVYWRAGDGSVQVAGRSEFAKLAASGGVTSDTAVFDTTVTTADGWRDRFERRARESWHATLLAGAAS